MTLIRKAWRAAEDAYLGFRVWIIVETFLFRQRMANKASDQRLIEKLAIRLERLEAEVIALRTAQAARAANWRGGAA